MLQILLESSPLSQIVLAILIAFSIASWATVSGGKIDWPNKSTKKTSASSTASVILRSLW